MGVVTVSSVSAAMKEIRKGRSITAASDNGAINVWHRDDGRIQCEFMQFRESKSSRKFRKKASVKSWLVEWFPKISGASE